MSSNTASDNNSKIDSTINFSSSSFWRRILIAVFLVLPVLGASAYMWAMWNPKIYMRDIPLAVVSEDKGVGEGAEFSNYGEKIAKGMLDLDYLNFERLSADEAQTKLNKGELMMIVTIPQDFSKKAKTIIDDKPVKPDINFELNDFYGTQSAFITSSLIPELQASVSQAVSQEYATKVVAGINDLSNGLRNASDGADRLDDGAGKLQAGGSQAVDGIARLKNGSGQLRDGTSQLKDGTGELKNGSTQLRDGAGQLSDGMDKLRDGTTKLADGAGQIKDGVGELTGKLIPLLSQVQGPSQDLRPAINALRSVGMTSEADELESLINNLNPDNPENLVLKLGKLRDGTAELHYNLSDPNAPYLSGVVQLQDGAHRLRDGTIRLDEGATKLDNGATQLNDGTIRLDDGVGELSAGGDKLKDGMDQLKDGTNKLSTGLADGVKRAPVINSPDVSSTNIANPINFVQNKLNPVQTAVSEEDPTATKITSGVSILLIILFSFLLMAILAIILPAIVRRRGGKLATLPGTALGYVGLAASSIVVVGILTAVAAAMGWKPANWSTALFTLLLVALAGSAVFHFLHTAFSRVTAGILVAGTFVIGLFASGAIWPADTTPAPLRLLHIIHPMGYARDAFIRMSEGIYDGTYARGIMGLIVFIVISLVASFIVTHRRHGSEGQSSQSTTSTASATASAPTLGTASGATA